MSNDDVASMGLAVNHLVQLGHAEIGLALGPERYTPVIRKVQGFRLAMREHLGMEPAHLERLVTHTVFSLEGGAAARPLISRGATAVICGSDLMALGAIRQARSMTVPRDVSVVGYDDSTMMAFTNPPLTTIRQSVEAMGRRQHPARRDRRRGSAAGGVRVPARVSCAGSTGAESAPAPEPCDAASQPGLARRRRHPYGSGHEDLGRDQAQGRGRRRPRIVSLELCPSSRSTRSARW